METLSVNLDLSNPTIAGIIGAIAGAVASFIPQWILTKRSESQFTKNIKSLVKQELILYSEFIEKILAQGSTARHSGILSIQDNDLIKQARILLSTKTTMDFVNFTIYNYDKLEPEIKARAFQDDLLIELELLYQRIRKYGIAFVQGNYEMLEDQIKQLKENIDKITVKLN